jgi:nucleoside-diphosphate-sugar epimerase
MKIFLTGATGYIGSIVAEKLLQKGHQVVALARSENSAKKLEALGIEVVFGDLDDLSILTKAAKNVDGIIHTGFKQSENGFLASMKNERKTVEALMEGIKNSDKPIIYTSGTGLLGDTQTIIFDEYTPTKIDLNDNYIDNNDEMTQATVQRMKTESDVLDTRGVRGIILRPPNVYGRSNGQALLTHLIGASKKICAVPYANFSGDHLWTFVHVEDLADLYVLALEKSKGGEMYYAGGETALKTKDIAKALSYGLGYQGETIAVEMDELINLFGSPFMANFWTWNNQSSNEKAKRLLNWQPNHIHMLKEIAKQNV